MSMQVIMDLKPKKDETFKMSKSGKSASMLCVFSGCFNSKDTVDIELMVNKQTSFGRPVDVLIRELDGLIANGSLFRVTGQLERLAYQEKDSGREIDKLRLVAYQISESSETEPIFSVAAIQGNVKLHTKGEFYKETGGKCSASFLISTEPASGYEKEAFLTVFVSAFGGTAKLVNRIKIKEKSYVMATGKLAAGNTPGLLLLKLADVSYAKFPKKA